MFYEKRSAVPKEGNVSALLSYLLNVWKIVNNLSEGVLRSGSTSLSKEIAEKNMINDFHPVLDMIGMRTKAPKSTEGKMVNGKETLRLRSKGAATVQEVVSFTCSDGQWLFQLPFSNRTLYNYILLYRLQVILNVFLSAPNCFILQLIKSYPEQPFIWWSVPSQAKAHMECHKLELSWNDPDNESTNTNKLYCFAGSDICKQWF